MIWSKERWLSPTLKAFMETVRTKGSWQGVDKGLASERRPTAADCLSNEM